jgi:hypothetical protein
MNSNLYRFEKWESKVMNISWSIAPDWANYLAMDSDGKWFWYEKKPVAWEFRSWDFDIGYWRRGDGRAMRVVKNWRDTLEKRPP